MLLPFLAVLLALINFAQGQDCTLDQPCTDAAALQRFAQYNNPELFTPIQEACGDATLTSLTTLVFNGECATEISKAPGCECSAECSGKVDAVTEQACKDQIIETFCENAEDIATEAQFDVRSLFLHLLNDCSTLSEVTCPAGIPAFDASVCEGLEKFPAEGPDSVNSTTRCKPGLVPDEAAAPAPLADADTATSTPSGAVEETDREASRTPTSPASYTAVSALLVMLPALLCMWV